MSPTVTFTPGRLILPYGQFTLSPYRGILFAMLPYKEYAEYALPVRERCLQSRQRGCSDRLSLGRGSLATSLQTSFSSVMHYKLKTFIHQLNRLDIMRLNAYNNIKEGLYEKA